MVAIGEREIEDIAAGSAVLGAGGGGSPYIGTLLAKGAIRAYGEVALVDPDDLGPDALALCVCMVGSPTIGVEKLWNGVEGVRALEAFEALLDRPITHVACLEVGGLNSTVPFAMAAGRGLPVVDGDLMGRAFPHIEMCMPTLYGITTSVAVADEKGNSAVIHAVDNYWIERLTRTFTVQVGCQTMAALFPLTASQVREAMVLRTVSQARSLGQRIRTAHEQGLHPVESLVTGLNGTRLFQGKVVDVDRRTEDGWARGAIRVVGLGPHEGREMTIDFQNEYLVARLDGRPVVTVPDLVIVLDSDTGHAITTEELRYGFRVDVIGAPCDPRFRTDAGLALVGPPAFGYPDLPFVGVGEAAACAA